MDQAATTPKAQAPAASRAAEPLDLEKLTAEIEALAQMTAAAAAPQTPSDSADDDGATSTVGAVGAAPHDLSQIEREIEALLSGGTPAAATLENAATRETRPAESAGPDAAPETGLDRASTPGSTIETSTDTTPDSEFDRLREALDGPSAPPQGPAASTPAPADPRRDALVEPPVDPLLQEVESLLADDADSLMRASGGDIGRAIDSVFDPRALSGQEEDVSRALIEAFGSTRSLAFSFGDASITNPAPRFDGVSKEVSPDTPRVDLERAARVGAAAAEPKKSFDEIAADSLARKPVEYAGEKPFEPAFPPLPVDAADPRAAAAPAAEAVPQAAAITAATTTATTTSTTTSRAATPPGTETLESAEKKATAITRGPSAASRLVAGTRRAIVSLACAPVAVLAFPMRFVPTNARGIVGIAAVTTALWVPVAWWQAAAQARKPGVGPVALVERPAADAEATGTESPAESDDPAKSTPEPAKSGH